MNPNATTIAPTAQALADRVFDATFEQSGQFRIELPFDDACEFVRRIDRYNDFQAENVVDALEAIDRLIPRTSYGERDYALSVGREGSPVIYLERFEWFREPLSDQVVTLICHKMKDVGVADEADVEIHTAPFNGGRRITFRFWWD